MTIIDTILFFAYLAGIVFFGSSFYRKGRSARSFTLGNKNIPTWVISMSIFATFVSSISFLALPGQAYQSNWNAFVFSISIPFAIFMAVRFFVPLYRSVGSPSAYTYLETRFGPWAKYYASAMYLLTQLMRSGTILYLLALPLHVILGWNMPLIIIVTGISVMVYAILGGIEAVIWTDAIQGIILIGGALAALIQIIFKLPGGFGQFMQIALEHHKFSLGSFSLNLSGSTFWVVFLYGLFINLQNYGIDQNYIQRYLTAASEKEAKKSVLTGGLLYIPVSFVFFAIGTALFAYYQVFSGSLPHGMTADSIFPFYIIREMPAGLTGLLISAVFAAGMSTISTSVNSSATIILHDYSGRWNDHAGKEKQSMKILYLASFLFGLASIAVALSMINVKSALDAWWKLASVFSGGMLGLFLLGYFAPKIKSTAAATGAAAGVLVIAWLSLSPFLLKTEFLSNYTGTFHPYLSIVFGTMAIFMVGFLTGLLIRKVKNNKSNL